MTTVDSEPAPRAGGSLLLRAALIFGIGLTAPWLAACGQGTKAADTGAAPAEGAPARTTAPLLGESTLALLPAAIQAKEGDPSSFTVDSFVAALLVEALSEGRSGLALEPRLDGEGATQGYRVASLAEDSPFARLGLREGDVVGAINGIGMTSPERAREAVASARRHAVVAVERGETAVFLDIRLVDGLAWSARVRAEGGEAVAEEPPVAVVDATALVAAVDDAELAELAESAKAGGDPGAGGAQPGTGPGKTIGGGARPAKGGGGTPSSGGGAGKKGGSKGGSSGGSSGGKSSGGGSSSASCASADSCTIRRSELDAVLANPAQASKQVRYKPHISGGKHRGYRLTSVTPGSAVAGLGMRKGDVITKVNGYSLTDEGDLFALYMGLSGASTFRVNYERGGAKRVKTVRVR